MNNHNQYQHLELDNGVHGLYSEMMGFTTRVSLIDMNVPSPSLFQIAPMKFWHLNYPCGAQQFVM